MTAWLKSWPTSLRTRLAIAFMAAAGLPATVLATVIALRGDTDLADIQVAAGWLIGCLLVSAIVASALAARIAQPLGLLEQALRNLDPELNRDLPAAPPGSPREIAVVFQQLHSLAERLRISYGELDTALARGEQLRGDLVRAIQSREDEIAGRTEVLRQANLALDRQARLDPLTGVANRRGLTEALDRAWRTATRDGQAVSLLMIDIDHFKAYNDCYGHPQGDSCLRAVANALGHVAGRSLDTVARYGGEEFVVILGNTPLEGALKVAEQVRVAIEAMQVPHRATPGGHVVTVSVGVTSAVPVRGSHYDSTLAAADRALYVAKAQGRNRVGYASAAGTGVFDAVSVPGNAAQRPS